MIVTRTSSRSYEKILGARLGLEPKQLLNHLPCFWPPFLHAERDSQDSITRCMSCVGHERAAREFDGALIVTSASCSRGREGFIVGAHRIQRRQGQRLVHGLQGGVPLSLEAMNRTLEQPSQALAGIQCERPVEEQLRLVKVPADASRRAAHHCQR